MSVMLLGLWEGLEGNGEGGKGEEGGGGGAWGIRNETSIVCNQICM